MERARDEFVRRRIELELWAAIVIQKYYRGMQGRMKFDVVLRDKKGKWKELYDEEKDKRFFYNQLTGEIRHRMPQDLLDLIPRPACDNCNQLHAVVECGVCNEVYCQACFEQVHSGGRRRDHDFRALYDYYNKRIDYGDGDLAADDPSRYPCTWPSEVIQDEIQGWMLRVAPIRDPTSQYGSWEVYTEIGPQGEVGRDFYFNRATFETTYDKPLEIHNVEQQTLEFNVAHSYGYYDDNGEWVPYMDESFYSSAEESEYQQLAYYAEDGAPTPVYSPAVTYDTFDKSFFRSNSSRKLTRDEAQVAMRSFYGSNVKSASAAKSSLNVIKEPEEVKAKPQLIRRGIFGNNKNRSTA